MKVFLSWSGEESKEIAKALYQWLPVVVQSLEPFYSPEIEKGSRSIEEINEFLGQAQFGIICLTRENLQSPWIHYEVGALARARESRIWTLLHNVPYTDVRAPLAQFQHTLTNQEEATRLLMSMNGHLEQPLAESVLTASINKWWPELAEQLRRITSTYRKPAQKEVKSQTRDDQDLLREILEIVRSLRSEGQPRISSRLANLPSLKKMAEERNRVQENVAPPMTDDIPF